MSIGPRRGLFDTGITRPPPPKVNERDPEKRKVFTVTQITRHIKDCIERGIGAIWVEGELSNFRAFQSGHCYFTLKDDGTQLPAVMWRMEAERLRFVPQDGTKILAFGRISVYETRGQYQMIVERMEPLGLGDLAAAFEQLKQKLGAEGLFNPERKRPLPLYPRRIGIVTSPSGAAIQDLMKVIFARWPAEILLAGVRVQGEGAAGEIAAAIAMMNRIRPSERPDVLIVGRGGGSMEDLWAFNEERVARAIAASKIPVISAVGHEVDFTIADFVADVRAATPSHAGELVVPRFDECITQVESLHAQLPAALTARVELALHRLDAIQQSYALRHPEERISVFQQRLDDLSSRLLPSAERLMGKAVERAASTAARLESLSPLKIVERGYSVTTREADGKLVASTNDVNEAELIRTRVRDGEIISRVERTDAGGRVPKK